MQFRGVFAAAVERISRVPRLEPLGAAAGARRGLQDLQGARAGSAGRVFLLIFFNLFFKLCDKKRIFRGHFWIRPLQQLTNENIGKHQEKNKKQTKEHKIKDLRVLTCRRTPLPPPTHTTFRLPEMKFGNRGMNQPVMRAARPQTCGPPPIETTAVLCVNTVSPTVVVGVSAGSLATEDMDTVQGCRIPAIHPNQPPKSSVRKACS